MRVALIGDVHANLSALEAVLDDAFREGAEELWNLGDMVGYAAHPDEVVHELRSTDALSIAGNYDRRVLEAGRKGVRPDSAKSLSPVWAFENLSPESRRFLGSLPDRRQLDRGDRRILLVHGSPESTTERLLPDTPAARLTELAHTARADVVVCGHSHVPFTRTIGSTTFVNPGSVGRSNDGDPRASYAVLDFDGRRLTAYHRRVGFDLAREVAAIRDRGLPEVYAQMVAGAMGFAEADAHVAGVLDRGTGAMATHLRRLQRSLDLAASCHYDVGHCHQVTWLALRLFDDLAALTQFDATERRWLLYAGILHDIGWIRGRKGHHKESLRRIETADLDMPRRETRIVGCVARYHRRAMPLDRHRAYRDLAGRDRRTVRELASMLRVADGLDRSHRNVVRALSATVGTGEVVLDCTVRAPAAADRRAALKKGDLFERTFRRRLRIECRTE